MNRRHCININTHLVLLYYYLNTFPNGLLLGSSTDSGIVEHFLPMFSSSLSAPTVNFDKS
jgi:hypothetical protein